jgi:transposase
MISKETEAEILRLYRIEKWKVGTICTQLGVHRDAVKRTVADWQRRTEDASEASQSPRRPMLIDPYRSFIQDTLEKYPKLRASRLYRMCKERGYAGRPDHFRHVIATLRPKPVREAYLRLNRLQGEEAQVDFAHFGKLQIGNRTWPLIALVVVLSWSRRIFLRFMPSMKVPWFLLAQAEALDAFGGAPRRMIYDNAKVCVLERRGDVIRYHPALLDFAYHYGFELRAAAPYRGNEKGRVERAIRYIRESFYAARSFSGLDDLNEQARKWCDEEARERRVPNSDRTVAEAFAEEQGRLIPLVGEAFPTDERQEAKVPKSPYVRFDRNDYSVPPELVGERVSVLASDHRVRILREGKEICVHPRSFEKGKLIEKPEHRDALWSRKQGARRGRAQDRLARAAPATEQILNEVAKYGDNLGSTCAQLVRLLDQYGADRLQKAAEEALLLGSPRPRSIRFLLERALHEDREPPRIQVPLPDELKNKDVFVRPHDLKAYDPLIHDGHDRADDEVSRERSNREEGDHGPA